MGLPPGASRCNFTILEWSQLAASLIAWWYVFLVICKIWKGCHYIYINLLFFMFTQNLSFSKRCVLWAKSWHFWQVIRSEVTSWRVDLEEIYLLTSAQRYKDTTYERKCTFQLVRVCIFSKFCLVVSSVGFLFDQEIAGSWLLTEAVLRCCRQIA